MSTYVLHTEQGDTEFQAKTATALRREANNAMIASRAKAGRVTLNGNLIGTMRATKRRWLIEGSQA